MSAGQIAPGRSGHGGEWNQADAGLRRCKRDRRASSQKADGCTKSSSMHSATRRHVGTDRVWRASLPGAESQPEGSPEHGSAAHAAPARKRLTDASGAHFGRHADRQRRLAPPFRLIEVFDARPRWAADAHRWWREHGEQADEFSIVEALIHLAQRFRMPTNECSSLAGRWRLSEEVLKYERVEHCVLAELGEAVVDAAKAHFQPRASRYCFRIRALGFRIGDGMA